MYANVVVVVFLEVTVVACMKPDAYGHHFRQGHTTWFVSDSLT